MERINEQLKRKIMRRIYFMFAVRKALSPVALKLYAFIALLWFGVSQVSMGNIIANMPQVTNVSAFYDFYTSALVNTEFAVQMILAGIAFFIVWMIWDMKRNLFAAQVSRV